MLSNKDMGNIIERVLNKIDYRLIDHGHRVAYSMMKVLESLEYSQEYIRDITMVSLIHDIGAYKTEEIDQMMYFETDKVWEHSIYGYLFLKYLSPISKYDYILLYHHLTYQEIKNMRIENKEIIQLLYLIDRIDIYWHQDNKLEKIEDFFKKHQGTKFSKESIDIFKEADKKYHILKKVYLDKDYLSLTAMEYPTYSKEDLSLFLRMISFTIDFRSSYMAAHCMTTASIASSISKIMNLDEETSEDIFYGAILHDIGKVATPMEILNARYHLSTEEMSIMREHILHTISILKGCIKTEVANIAGRHHERVDGSGYPLGLEGRELALGERIVAVADVFSALIGKRSYKNAYAKEMTITIINDLVEKKKIDSMITSIILQNYDAIMANITIEVQPQLEVYKSINREYIELKTRAEEKRMLDN